MPLHVEQLICNVRVALAGTAADQSPSEETNHQVPLEFALPRVVQRAMDTGGMAEAITEQTQALAEEGALPPEIDVQKLADRVYNLMRDEMQLTRERGGLRGLP